MIYTVDPQRYGDPELGLFDTIYLEAHSPVWSDTTALSPKTFQPTVRFSVSMYRMINGELKFWKKNDAIYRQETWLGLFGDVTPNDFKANLDQYMIDQIVWVNTHEWTGEEIQVAGYWKENITDASGLAVYVPPPAPQEN
jgi:hypothetical protein